MNVWTRQRRLLTERDTVLKELVMDQVSLKAELDHDDWIEASRTAERIRYNARTMQVIKNELDDVTELIDTFDSITKRMEELEKQAQEIEL